MGTYNVHVLSDNRSLKLTRLATLEHSFSDNGGKVRSF